jgi:prepilin-type N-terminal cleavage/methylation domain-containing protein
MPAVTAAPRAPRRAGFTLPELLTVIVLLGVVVAAIMTVIVRQQRFYRGAADIIELRGNLRQALDVLPAELRGLAPQLDDITAMSDSAIAFRTQTGGSVACRILNSGLGSRNLVVLPPQALRANNGLTGWTSTPLAGEEVLIADTATAGNGDDTWRRYRIVAAPTKVAAASAGCLTAGGFTRTATEEANSLQITVADSVTGLSVLNVVSPTTPVGAPVRFVRYVRYSLYLSPTDNKWYLGDSDSLPGQARAAVQPVAGPFQPYAAGRAGGIAFTYYDATGAVITTTDQAARRAVRRIDITARAPSRRAMNMPGFGKGTYVDSLTVSVTPRNLP